MKKYTIGFIGAGNMGGAIASAYCKKNSPATLAITGKDFAKAQGRAQVLGCDALKTNCEIVESSKFIMLGVKPQMQADVLAEIAPTLKKCIDGGEEKYLVSMAAGISCETMEKNLGFSTKIMRIMPNTPVGVGCGMILVSPASAGDDVASELMELLQASGRFDVIPEKMIDAATVPAGCAPAFAYMFIEALADGAVLTGVPRAKAMEYAAQAVRGAATLVLESGIHPGALKDAVCSPGGSTIVGVAALEEGGMRSAAIKAVTSAYAKTLDLGK